LSAIIDQQSNAFPSLIVWTRAARDFGQVTYFFAAFPQAVKWT
jgi:hypothetical protein